MSQAAVINARSIAKHFARGPERITPFADLSLEILRGQVAALVGPSGSGKSTLLNCLAGIESIDEGSLHVAGSDLSQLSSGARDRWRAQHVGLVFQAFNLIEVLNARDNVLLGLAGKSPSKADRARADELLERVGLADRRGHRPSQLSGGQQQRVAIARALIHQPQLILADEPTGNLDASGAQTIRELLVELARAEGRTVVIVTHDPQVAAVCDSIYHLQGGGIQAAAAAVPAAV